MEELEKAAPRRGEWHGDEGSLVDTNFRNTVIYYMDELLRIEAGELATEHLKDRQRKALVKSGGLWRLTLISRIDDHQRLFQFAIYSDVRFM